MSSGAADGTDLLALRFDAEQCDSRGLYVDSGPLISLVSNRPAQHWRSAQPPRASFVVLSFNNALYLGTTLESVSAQTFEDMEIIVGDDGSTDSSVEVIHAWLARESRPAMAVLWRANGGIARNYNGALRWSRGEVIFHIGSDDINAPDRVVEQLKMLDSTPAAMCISGMEIIDHAGRHVRQVAPARAQQDLHLVLAQGGVAVTSPTMAYKRALIDRFGLLPGDLANEDEALAFRALAGDGVCVLDRSLVQYRIHATSVTARNRQLTWSGYLAWLEGNLPFQIANKRHWLAVLQTVDAPAEHVARTHAWLEVLEQRLNLLRSSGWRRRIGGTVLLLRAPEGRHIARAFVMQALRALRLAWLLARARRGTVVAQVASK